jgi:predicted alpha/beta hydrolase family esterase
MRPVLLVPGIGDSYPVRADWVEALEDSVARATAPPVLVAHSLGCLAVAHWATQSARTCFAALLVAVPDPSGPAFPSEATGFAPLPSSLRKCRAMIVSSIDDAYASRSYTEERVATWGAEHICLGERGHINAASGLGDWPDGWAIVDRWRNE